MEFAAKPASKSVKASPLKVAKCLSEEFLNHMNHL